jgi:CRISPR-associated protein Csb1
MDKPPVSLIADALLRDSLLGGLPFRESREGSAIDHVDIRNATALFEICPTSLVFGMWDSTGPKGGLGAKFQRALVSEIVGINVEPGVRTSSRIDPAQIVLGAGPLYHAKGGGWTLDESQAMRSKNTPAKLGKDGKPSEANHGNVTPSIASGGMTLDKAVQTTVISLPSLRRLRFPLNDGSTDERVDDAARTALAALALCAATLTREQGCDLRSRCLLVPTTSFAWELLGTPDQEPARFMLNVEAAIALLNDAVNAAKEVGLAWMDDELVLHPSPELLALVKKSQMLAAAVGGDEGAE